MSMHEARPSGAAHAQPPAQAWGAPQSWSGSPVAGTPHRRYAATAWAPVPRPGFVPIRQLAFFELLDGGLRAIRANPRTVLGVPAVVNAGIAVLTWVLGALVFWTFMNLGGALAADDASVIGAQLAIQAAASVLGILSYSWVVFFAGTSVHALRRGLFNEKPTLRESLRVLRGHRLRLLGLTAVFAGAQALVLVLLCLPAVLGGLAGGALAGALLAVGGLLLWGLQFAFCYVRFMPAGAALVCERLGVWAALSRSWQLTGRGFFRLLGLQLTGAVIVSTVVSIIITPLTYVLTVVLLVIGITLENEQALIALLVVLLAILSALATLVNAIVFAYLASITVLIYTDQRIRLEGHDIALLAEAERLAAERVRP